MIGFIANSECLNLSDIGWEINDYITLDLNLRKQILDVYYEIKSYIERAGDEEPMNILIFAPSGAGKSHLVQCLRRKAEHDIDAAVDFNEINLGCVQEFGELRHLFDSVRDSSIKNTQFPFALFDEIDTEIYGDSFYKILAPAMSGSYQYEGRIHPTGSSVFFFAGTFQSQLTNLKKMINAGGDTDPTHIVKEYQDTELDVMSSFPDSNNWQQNAQQGFMALADSGIYQKLADFFDRIDRLIMIPPLHLYFKSQDLQEKPYYLDQEAIYYFISGIEKMWQSVIEIERFAIATLAWHFYRSRRQRKRGLFSSRIQPGSSIFRLSDIPEYLRVDEQINELSEDLGINLEGTIAIK